MICRCVSLTEHGAKGPSRALPPLLITEIMETGTYQSGAGRFECDGANHGWQVEHRVRLPTLVPEWHRRCPGLLH